MTRIAGILGLLLSGLAVTRPALAGSPIAPDLTLTLNMPAGVDPPADKVFFDGDAITGAPVFDGASLLADSWEFHVDPGIAGIDEFGEIDLLLPFVGGVTVNLGPPIIGYVPWQSSTENTLGGTLVRFVWVPGAGKLGGPFPPTYVLWGALSATTSGGDAAGLQLFEDTPISSVAYFQPQSDVPEPGPMAILGALLACGAAFALARRGRVRTACSPIVL